MLNNCIFQGRFAADPEMRTTQSGLTVASNGPTGASKFVHRKNDDLDSTYELLTALGYEMADDEKALQDGTHQLFAVYGSGSKADTPCDKCKAAHPECDKCCKTCDDHCNAFQLCRKEYGE